MIHKQAVIGAGTLTWFPEQSNIGICEIGSGCIIHSHVWIGDGVKIGNRVKIQAFSFLPTGVTIEDDVFIAPHVVFTNDPDLAVKGKEFWKPILVKKGAKIGANVSIRAGVTIGENAIIGMGSVVLHDIPDNTTVAGNPARQI